MRDDKKYTFIVPAGKKQDFYDDFKQLYGIKTKPGQYVKTRGKKIPRSIIPYGTYVKLTKGKKSYIAHYDTLEQLPPGLVIRQKDKKTFISRPGVSMMYLPYNKLDGYVEQNGALIDKDGKVLINIIRTGNDLMFLAEAKINIITTGMFVKLKSALAANYVVDEAHTMFLGNNFTYTMVEHDSLLAMTATALSNHLADWFRMLKIFQIKYTDLSFAKAKETYIKEYYNYNTMPGLNVMHEILLPIKLKVPVQQILGLHKDYFTILKKPDQAKTKRELEDVYYDVSPTAAKMLDYLTKYSVVYFKNKKPVFDLEYYKSTNEIIELPKDYLVIDHKITENIFKNLLLSGIVTTTNIDTQEPTQILVDKTRYAKLGQMLKDKPKAVIFYNYKSEYKLLKQVIKIVRPNAEIYSINGSLKDFKDNAGTADSHYTLCQYRSASEGINGLQLLYDKLIFFSIPLSAKSVSQAMGRIDRKGQTSDVVNYYRIVANRLEDGKNLDRVINGIDLQGKFYEK